VILLPQPPECWDYRYVSPHLGFIYLLLLLFVILGIKPRASHMLGKCSTTCYSLPLFVFFIYLFCSLLFLY
jgi:hypothetical protein